MKSEQNILAIAVIRLLLLTVLGAFPLLRAQGQEACCLALPDYPENSISVDMTAYYPSPATA